MKKLLLLSFLFCYCFGTPLVFAQTTPTLQQKLQVGLLFYTPLTANQTDSSRFKQVGTLTGAEIETNSRCGSPSMYFDGKDDMIDYGQHSALDRKFREMTISVWIKPQGTASLPDFFGLIVGRWAFDAQKDQFAMFLNSRQKVVFAVGDGTNDSEGVYTRKALADGIWYHVVVKWQHPNKVKFYINGRVDSEGTEDKTIGMNQQSTISLKIGRQLLKYNRAFHGNISHLRIYGRGLNDEEVKELYEFENSRCITFTLEGSLLNADTKLPIETPAEITIKDLKTGKDVLKTQSDAIDAYYSMQLPAGFQYGIFAKAEQYKYISINQNVDTRLLDKKPKAGIEQEITFKRDLLMVPFAVGGKVRANNLFFETNKADLQGESLAELDQMVQMFVDIPTLVLEIGGHTDNVGSPQTNKKLSEARANAVRNYLITKGIAPERIIAKGYGEEKPIADNTTDEGKAANRRVEFTILKT